MCCLNRQLKHFSEKELILLKILQNSEKYVIVFINHNIMAEFCRALYII